MAYLQYDIQFSKDLNFSRKNCQKMFVFLKSEHLKVKVFNENVFFFFLFDMTYSSLSLLVLNS